MPYLMLFTLVGLTIMTPFREPLAVFSRPNSIFKTQFKFYSLVFNIAILYAMLTFLVICHTKAKTHVQHFIFITSLIMRRDFRKFVMSGIDDQ